MSRSRAPVPRGPASLATLAAVLAAGPVGAAEPVETIALPQEARVVARVQALSDEELKDFYLRCSRAAMRQQLGHGELAVCSIGYHTLLSRTFGGDYLALYGWSKRND